MQVEIIVKDPQKVASVRHVGPYAECAKAWETLFTWARPKGLLKDNTQYIGLEFDDPGLVAADKLRYDACITLSQDVPVEGDIVIQDIPGGKYAVTTHKGHYESLRDSYEELCGAWFPSVSKKIKKGPAVEVYLNDPKNTAPEELLTEIWMPIED